MPPTEPLVTAEVDSAVGDWLTVPDLAEQLGIDVSRTRQQLRDLKVPLVRRGERAVLAVPSDFVFDGRWVKGLPGLFTLFADGRYESNEALSWLFTADDSLPGTPMQALRENRGTEVKRRLQALAS